MQEEWSEIFERLELKKDQRRILNPTKLSLKSEGEIKTFYDKQNLREFVASSPGLQYILKEVL